MAIVEEHPPLELGSGSTGTITAPDPLGVFARPKATTGWRSWINTVDHKKIGIMYGGISLFFLLAKEDQTQGFVQVSVFGPEGRSFTTSVPVHSPFAVQDVDILTMEASRDLGRISIRIEAGGLAEAAAQGLADRLRAMPAVTGVGLGWRAGA